MSASNVLFLFSEQQSANSVSSTYQYEILFKFEHISMFDNKMIININKTLKVLTMCWKWGSFRIFMKTEDWSILRTQDLKTWFSKILRSEDSILFTLDFWCWILKIWRHIIFNRRSYNIITDLKYILCFYMLNVGWMLMAPEILQMNWIFFWADET